MSMRNSVLEHNFTSTRRVVAVVALFHGFDFIFFFFVDDVRWWL